MNWTLEDFYVGNKVCVEFNSNTDDIGSLRRLVQDTAVGLHKYYWGVGKDYHFCDFCPALPSAPLSYFISLLDAQEAAKQPEYIYEPFSEEAAKSGEVVVCGEAHEVVKWLDNDGNISAIKMPNGRLRLVGNVVLRIRRTIETKEVECYVYENGYISSLRNSGSPYIKIIDTFTHTIKIPKK